MGPQMELVQFVFVCVKQISSHLRAHCRCNLLSITTTMSMLFGDNSEGAGWAHFSFCLFTSSQLV